MTLSYKAVGLAVTAVIVIAGFLNQNKHFFTGSSYTVHPSRDVLESCRASIPPRLTKFLPTAIDFLHFREHRGVVTCYATNDIVCKEIRQHGEFEPDIFLVVLTAARRLQYEANRATTLLLERLASSCGASRKDVMADRLVTYIDIGGNVGSFAMMMWRAGFRLSIFEAMNSNAAMLEMSICMNRAEAASAGEVLSDITLHHAALGPEGSTGNCVLASGSDNVGDGALTCDPIIVAQYEGALRRQQKGGDDILDEADKSMLRSLRSVVALRTLDAFMHANDSFVSQYFRGGLPSSCDVGSDALSELVTHQPRQRPGEPLKWDSYTVRRVVPQRVDSSWSTEKLKAFLVHSQVVVKIDVESFEYFVMQGAYRFLLSPVTRPKIIVSEVWKSADITAYCELMIVIFGYAVYSHEERRWIRFVDDAAAFHRNAKFGLGTVMFVEPGYEYLVEPFD